jgi:3-methyladenine DNA glycosylase AlkD
MAVSSFTSKVEAELKRLADITPKGEWDPSDYIIGQSKSDLQFFNLNIPTVRSVLKNKNIFPLDRKPQDVYRDIQKMWFESNWFEARTICLIWLESQPLEFLIAKQTDLVKWAKLVDNWAHSDGLCGFLARIYDADSKYLHSIFTEWHIHNNTWYRRISMVSLFYYSRSRVNQPKYNVAEKYIKANLDHPDYYVQKGVGWTLREMYNVYPQLTLPFIEKHVKDLSSVAWVAATEKLPKTTKNNLMRIRKA